MDHMGLLATWRNQELIVQGSSVILEVRQRPSPRNLGSFCYLTAECRARTFASNCYVKAFALLMRPHILEHQFRVDRK